jgi:serine/threonine-protein kinase
LSGGVVRRDTWEEYFDRTLSQLGLGQPIVPLDGLTRPDYFDVADAELVSVRTNKPSNIFAPGDEMIITVVNNADQTMFVELIGTSVEGRKVILIPAGTQLAVGDSLRFPSEGTITIKPKLGKEEVTLLASFQDFPAGQVLKGRQMRDRVVHRFYQLAREGSSHVLQNQPTDVVKKTISIETR